MTTPSALIKVMSDAVRKAARGLTRDFGEVAELQVSKKGPADYVSAADIKSEQVMFEALAAARPGYGFLGEERGLIPGTDKTHTWIVDPLDGTTNFLHAIPHFAITVALEREGQIVAGVTYNPITNEHFWTEKGRGAFLNDKRIRVSKRTRLSEALIGTGFPFRQGDDLSHYLRMLEIVMKSCAGVRRPGAAALDLCYVAAGWYDAFFETGLSPWDVAAGSLIVTEAGGLVGNFTGVSQFLHQREVLAGSPKIYGQLVHLLAPFSNVGRDVAGATTG